MSATASALFASIVRTVTPIIVGAILGWAVGLGITLDPQFETLLTAAITGGFTAIYYIAARLLETYVTPKFGWLLGLAKSPAVYTVEPPTSSDAALSASSKLVSVANGFIREGK